MAMVIGGGIVLLGLFLLFGRLWGGATPDLALAAKAFVPVWLVIALVNMWAGVTKAGYTVAQELPILPVVFAVSAILVAVPWWQGRSETPTGETDR